MVLGLKKSVFVVVVLVAVVLFFWLKYVVSIIVDCYKRWDNCGKHSRKCSFVTRKEGLTEKELEITTQITLKIGESINLLINFAKFRFAKQYHEDPRKSKLDLNHSTSEKYYLSERFSYML